MGLKNESEELIATSIIYYQPWKKFLLRAKVLYGPIIDYEDNELVVKYIKELLKYLKKNKRVISLRLSAILDNKFYRDINIESVNPTANDFLFSMQNLGAKLVRLSDSESDDVPIRFMYSKDLSKYTEDDIFQSVKKKLAGPFAYGMSFELLDPSDFPILEEMMNYTSERKVFTMTSEHAFDLYRSYWQENRDDVFVPAIYLDINKFLYWSNLEREEYLRLKSESEGDNSNEVLSHNKKEFGEDPRLESLRNKKWAKKFLKDYQNQLKSLDEKIDKIAKLKDQGLNKIPLVVTYLLRQKQI